MDRNQTYRLRIVLGTDDGGEPIEACVIGRSWGNSAQACKFANQNLKGHKIQLVVSCATLEWTANGI